MEGWIEAAVVVGAVLAFDVLALRFGHDSRDGIASDEWARRRAAYQGTETDRMIGLLAEELAHERRAQLEHEAAHARLLREATRGRGTWWTSGGTVLRRAAAAGVALAGGWLVRGGTWLQSLGQSLGAVPVTLEQRR
jgi:hypothetical protein